MVQRFAGIPFKARPPGCPVVVPIADTRSKWMPKPPDVTPPGFLVGLPPGIPPVPVPPPAVRPEGAPLTTDPNVDAKLDPHPPLVPPPSCLAFGTTESHVESPGSSSSAGTWGPPHVGDPGKKRTHTEVVEEPPWRRDKRARQELSVPPPCAPVEASTRRRDIAHAWKLVNPKPQTLNQWTYATRQSMDTCITTEFMDT